MEWMKSISLVIDT